MSTPEFTAENMKSRFATNTPKTTFVGTRGRGSADDTDEELGDTRTMTNEITRHELDAKLETIEARMDGRIAAIGSKIDVFLAAQSERDKASDRRFESIETNMVAMRTEVREDIRSMKTTSIVTAISAVLAIVIGVAGFNAMLTSNMMAAFQLGKGEASSQAAPVAPAAVILQVPPADTAPQQAPQK